MPFSGLNAVQVLLLVIATVGIAIGITVMIRFRFRPAPDASPEEMIRSAEKWKFWLEVPLVVLACVLILPMVWLVLGYRADEVFVYPFPTTVHLYKPWILLAPTVVSLLALRWIRSPALGVWFAGIVFFSGSALAFHGGRIDFFRDIEVVPTALPPQYASSYFIPTQSMMAVQLGLLPALLLAGLTAYSFHRRWYTFVLGGLLLPQVGYWIIQRSVVLFHRNDSTAKILAQITSYPDNSKTGSTQDWIELLLFNVAAGLVFVLIWGQRRQRDGLLRAAGMLDRDRDITATQTLASVGRHLFVGFTVLHLSLVVAGAKLTADLGRHYTFGPPILPHTAGLVNGWSNLSSRFRRDESKSARQNEVGNLYLISQKTMSEFPAPVSLLSTKDALTSDVRAEIARAGETLGPWIADFERASLADYISSNDGQRYVMMSYLHLRQVARYLSMSSQVAMVDEDWKRSLEPIRTLYRFTALEMDSVVVGHMIQLAIRSIGNQTTALYWQAFWDNPDAMDALQQVLDSTSPGNRRSFPWDNILRHEYGHRSVVLYAEMLVPVFNRAIRNYTRVLSGIDRLRIATAAARFRNNAGAWPNTIGDLVPRYLDHIPVQADPPHNYQFSIDTEAVHIGSADDESTTTKINQEHYPSFLLHRDSTPR